MVAVFSMCMHGLGGKQKHSEMSTMQWFKKVFHQIAMVTRAMCDEC